MIALCFVTLLYETVPLDENCDLEYQQRAVAPRSGLRFLTISDTDIFMPSETKTQDDAFPGAAFANAGWPHRAIRGEKSYNGVAILSRQPLVGTGHRDWAGRGDCRHIWAQTESGIKIHNFYVPAGGDIPDLMKTPNLPTKLQFIDEMTRYFAAQLPQAEILVGDLNIAPLAMDVWSSKQLLKIVSHTPVETDGLKRLMAEGGWHDAVRGHFGAAASYILGGPIGPAIGRQ